MSPTYAFDYGLVLGTDSRPLPGGSAVLKAWTSSGPGSAVQAYDLQGSPITKIVANEYGLFSPFGADVIRGYLDFGGIVMPVLSTALQDAVQTAQDAVAKATQAASSATASAQAAQQAQAALQAYIDSHPSTGSGSTSGSGTPTDGSVTTAKLADNAVTSAKIAAGAVTLADLADEVTGRYVVNAGGVTSILSRTKTQGLPSTVVNGQLVVIPV